ncbi:hypothetical protein J2W21_001693 [Sinomonas atrocyanea]|uniref:hypothetical protein n=1 Tax=Sinomonas atrocyanea TaxID=37927 RepID=UPI002784CF23|nr:hypothetical protein [Sinomonas atrocyanea]MDP9884183.1 hypothetical protein [Sinomonas atrocyanea]
MKKISNVRWNSKNPAIPTIAPTGVHCPVNGLWEPLGSPADPVFVFEGSVMPTLAGASVEWQLVQVHRRRADLVL